VVESCGGGVFLTQVHDKDLEDFGRAFAIFDGMLGLKFNAGGNGGIEAGVVLAGDADRVVGVGLGDAGLARLLDDLEGWAIENLAILKREEIFGVVMHKRGRGPSWRCGLLRNGADWCGLVRRTGC